MDQTPGDGQQEKPDQFLEMAKRFKNIKALMEREAARRVTPEEALKVLEDLPT